MTETTTDHALYLHVPKIVRAFNTSTKPTKRCCDRSHFAAATVWEKKAHAMDANDFTNDMLKLIRLFHAEF